VKRSLSLVVVVGLVSALSVGAAACSSSDESASNPAPAVATEPTAPVTTMADELSVDEVAVYQAVKTFVVKDGAVAAKPNAPVIAARPAFIRVFVKAVGRTRPIIDGELRVKRAGKPDLVLKDSGKRVVAELDDEMLEQTLNFAVGAEDMTPDATFSFRAGSKLDSTDPRDVVSFPADGTTAPFNAKTASQKLRVKFVPVTYEAVTGTSLTPDLADVATLKDTLYKMYPVASVEITVREPLKWSTPVEADGPGWSALLSGIMQLRRADKADRDVYYVGVFTPKETIDQFCAKGSCILGIAPQASERDVGMRAALVLGYGQRGAGSTLAQELAHAMGRLHAPCGSPQAIDDAYPYTGGGIGTWGYDVLKKQLVDPGRYRDYMSYCGPTWVSDYTYQGVYDRMEILTDQQKAIDATPPSSTGTPPKQAQMQTQLQRSFLVEADGSVTEGPDLEVLAANDAHESGATVDVTYEGAGGRSFAAKGRVRSIAGVGSRLVVVPQEPAFAATRARLSGIGVSKLTARTLGH
jgi:hypothetical protein